MESESDAVKAADIATKLVWSAIDQAFLWSAADRTSTERFSEWFRRCFLERFSERYIQGSRGAVLRFVMLSASEGGAKHPTELAHTALWRAFLQNSFRFVLPSTVLGCFALLNMTTETGIHQLGNSSRSSLPRIPER